MYWTWMEHARCYQLGIRANAFFSDKPKVIAFAKKICAGCPVQTECRAHAIEHKEKYGVWGGTTSRERGWRIPKQSKGAA